MSQNCWVISLGSLDPPAPVVATRRFIFPDGFVSVRLFFSFVNPACTCPYVNEIFASPSGAVFRVTCLDAPQHPVLATSPTTAWTVMLARVRYATSRGLGSSPAVIPEKLSVRPGGGAVSQRLGACNVWHCVSQRAADGAGAAELEAVPGDAVL